MLPQETLTLKEQVKGLSRDTQVTTDEDAPFIDQLNTWMEQLELEVDWDTDRKASTRSWTAIPIMQTVRLTAFAGTGATRAAAENDAAGKILDSGILGTIFDGPRVARSQRRRQAGYSAPGDR
ncbi:hypothetical protein FRC08_017706 [Ceratobasidium sp. 394]|nr:hypothetical protein FRC08_017706 [Ceratobasidium sp. 394]